MNDNTHPEGANPSDEEEGFHQEEFDVFGSLTGDYLLRRQLGMETPDAVLHIDPELGPTWSVGIEEDGVEQCVGRGRLVGDVLEVTLFQTMPETESA